MDSLKRLGRAILPVFALALIGPLTLLGQENSVQAQEGNAPVLVYQNIEEGQTFSAPVFVVQLCFQDPINIKDLDKGGDFEFSLTAPDDFGLGLRIVFQPDGQGVSIYPGEPPGETVGEWSFKWRVTDPDDLTPAEGEIKYVVDPDGEPAPSATPPSCVAEGGTATPSGEETPAGTGPATRSVISTPTPEPTPEASPGEGEDGDAGEDEDDDNTVELVLITLGVLAALAVAGLVFYLVRRGVGYEPHQPTKGDDSTHGDH
jgi:hypothetical protein